MKSEFDSALKKVMRDLNSGKMYRDYLKDLKRMGLDPDKPLTLGFKDGHTEVTRPMRDMMPHLKPKKFGGAQ